MATEVLVGPEHDASRGMEINTDAMAASSVRGGPSTAALALDLDLDVLDSKAENPVDNPSPPSKLAHVPDDHVSMKAPAAADGGGERVCETNASVDAVLKRKRQLQLQKTSPQTTEGEEEDPGSSTSTGDDENQSHAEEEEDGEEEEEEHDLGELGTPALGTPVRNTSDVAGLTNVSHCFIGPSAKGKDRAARELHGLRVACLTKKPPVFESHIATHALPSPQTSGSIDTNSSSSSSSTHDDGRPHNHRCYSADQDPPATYTVSFTDESLGFKFAAIAAEQERSQVMVQVTTVDPQSAAAVAGVTVGDAVVSVNGDPVEAEGLDQEALLRRMSSASPRTIVFSRHQRTDSGALPASASSSASTSPTVRTNSSRLLRRTSLPKSLTLSSALSYGSSMLGSALKRKKPMVHKGIMCDGCGIDPITGSLWTCSVCPSYHLCQDCYEMGTHGMEDTDDMQALLEARVEHTLRKKCKRYTPEFLSSLQHDVCKNRLDKFEYLGLWIADIVNPTAASKIAVRGIEIPQLHVQARQNFVANLMPLVSNRRDIEVNIEWFPDDTEEATATSNQTDDEPTESMEKLRIWISDKKKRTTSPFASS